MWVGCKDRLIRIVWEWVKPHNTCATYEIALQLGIILSSSIGGHVFQKLAQIDTRPRAEGGSEWA